jgi:hypothetical protein
VQVAERRQDLQDVGESLVHRERVEDAVLARIRFFRICFSEVPPTYSMTM